MLASDLIENRPPVRGAYGGIPVHLIVSCPMGETAGCPGRVADWSGRLAVEGAGPVSSVRADAATTEIAKWMEPS